MCLLAPIHLSENKQLPSKLSWLSLLDGLPIGGQMLPLHQMKNIYAFFTCAHFVVPFSEGLTSVMSQGALPPYPILRAVSPFSRYVSRVLVYDSVVDKKWCFLCSSWLSIDVGDCVLDKVFPVATEQDRKQFRYFLSVFFSKCKLTVFFNLR